MGEEYESIEEYMLNGIELFPVDFIFVTLKEKEDAERNNYQGIYHFTLVYSDVVSDSGQVEVDYEFVFLDNHIDEDGEFLVLGAVLLPDLEIFNYLDPDVSEDGLYAKLHITYQPFLKMEWQNITDKYELIDFDRLIEPIYTNDLYVTENGVNYKISSPREEYINNIINVPISNFNKEIYDEMKEDSFLGIFRQHFVFNNGEKFTEDYTVYDVDNSQFYFKIKNAPIRNSFNTPQLIPMDNECGVMVVTRCIRGEYIPFQYEG